MMRVITVVFVLALMSSAQASPLAPVQQPDSIVTPIREACGAGCAALTVSAFALRLVDRPYDAQQECAS